jgi:hypothetical protein
MCAVLKAASRVLLLLTLVLASASAGRADPITPYASATNFFIDRLDGGTLQGFFTIGQVPNGETFVARPLLFDRYQNGCARPSRKSPIS